LPGGNPPEALRATGTDGANVLADCLAFSERFQAILVDSNGPEAVELSDGDLLEDRKVSRVFSANEGGSEEEAPPGFEPGMADLQSAALPLGEGAARRFCHVSGRPAGGQPQLSPSNTHLQGRPTGREKGSGVASDSTARPLSTLYFLSGAASVGALR
jgi:hypothetical protein